MVLEGIMTALITPLTGTNTVDKEKMEVLVDYQIKNRINSLLVLGGTGEYSALTFEERKRAVEIVVNYANGRIPVIAGVLEPGIGEAIKFSKASKEAGADGLLVLTPFYVHPTQEGILDFFKKLDKEVDIPFLLYNIPYRTYVNTLPDTVLRMANEIPNFIGMKECTPNLAQAIEVISKISSKVPVFCGEEFYAASEMMFGAKGAIMATANLVPNVWVRMYDLACGNKFMELAALTKQYFPLFRALFKEINPGPLKFAMKAVGIEAGEISIPLKGPSKELENEIMKQLDNLGLLKGQCCTQ